MASKEHLRFLDGIRAVAALVVITHHAWLQSWPYMLNHELRPTGLVRALTGWLIYGKLAVTAFIVISGFCLMLPVVRANRTVEAKQFFFRRCKRILPAYYAAFLLAFALDLLVLRPVTHTVYDGSFPLTVGGFISHVLLIQNFTPDPYEICAPLWSIAVEFQIYLFFPSFVQVYRRWGIGATLALTTAFGYGASLLFRQLGFPETYAHYVVMFGLGMAAAHFAFRLEGDAQRRAIRIAIATLPALVVIGLAVHHVLGSDKVVTDTMMGLVMAAVLLLSVLRPSIWFAKLLSVRPLVWVGSFSYSLYLVHYPLQQLFWQLVIFPMHLSRNWTFFLVATVGTALIVGLAYGFFWMFERPYLQQSKDGRKRAVLAETAV